MTLSFWQAVGYVLEGVGFAVVLYLAALTASDAVKRRLVPWWRKRGAR